MTQAAARQHWIVEALSYFGIPSEIPPGLTTTSAWKAAEDSSGLGADDLTRKIAARFKLGVADLGAADPSILKLVPEKLARLYTFFPLSATDRHLTLATSHPKDLAAEQAVGFASGRSVILRIAAPDLIQEVIDQRYSPERLVAGLLANVDAEINYTVRVVEEGEPEALDRGAIEATPVVKLTNVILRDGARQGASDIHIEPNRGIGTSSVNRWTPPAFPHAFALSCAGRRPDCLWGSGSISAL